jgi:hypothetical protein
LAPQNCLRAIPFQLKRWTRIIYAGQMLKFFSKETAEMLRKKIAGASLVWASIAGGCIIGVNVYGARFA